MIAVNIAELPVATVGVAQGARVEVVEQGADLGERVIHAATERAVGCARAVGEEGLQRALKTFRLRRGALEVGGGRVDGPSSTRRPVLSGRVSVSLPSRVP